MAFPTAVIESLLRGCLDRFQAGDYAHENPELVVAQFEPLLCGLGAHTSKSTPCKFFTSDDGCKHGGKCTYFHPRVTRDEGKCFNCGSKSHALKECDKPKPTKREPSKDAKPKRAASKSKGRSSSKPSKPKPKAAAAAADEASSANASSREPDFSYALLDSGATHVILNLSKLSLLGQRDGRSIGLRLAAGKQ
eukprot:103771-Amphidinium_carterae.1